MLDLPRLRRITLSPRPRMQKLLGFAMLMPNYRLPPRVRIDVEGSDNLPDEPVVYAMNHTDRYNYWPFQYWLWRDRQRFTATWVKGKYFENRLIGRFMELTNNIPAPSRGYVLSRDFLATVGRVPDSDEYRALRDLCDGADVDPALLPDAILGEPRDMLGRRFDPQVESYAECVNHLVADMMDRFVEINAQCFDEGLDLLVFPEGTRSRQLSRGRIGVAQVALRFGRPIVPIGCSGSDRCYPGGSPWARGGAITYRIGEPIPCDDRAALGLPDDVDPFATELEPEHRDAMQGLVDRVMDRINDLVDPEYRFSADHDVDTTGDARRFV